MLENNAFKPWSKKSILLGNKPILDSVVRMLASVGRYWKGVLSDDHHIHPYLDVQGAASQEDNTAQPSMEVMEQQAWMSPSPFEASKVGKVVRSGGRD